MALISPFAAVRYPQRLVTNLVAPPYDVLSPADKDRMLAKDGHNIVAVDLPHMPPNTAGPDEAYAAAGHTLRMWLETGVLKRDASPAFYPYQQTYTWAGTTYRRRGFFARVGLEEFSNEGSIHPHEQTFSGPKEDRLKLMRATAANLSPVFGLYDDPKNDVTDLLFEALAANGGMPPALATAELPGLSNGSPVVSEIWAVTDPGVIRDVEMLMADKHIYIADGHHRYTTCLNYRRELSELRGVPLDRHDPAQYAMFVLVALQDPGLIILPTHRAVSARSLGDFYLEAFEDAAAKTCAVMETKFNGDSLAHLEAELPAYGPHAMGVYDPVEDKAIVIKPKAGDPLGAIKDGALAGKSEAWRQLDVAILQHLVFERIVEPNFGAKGQKVSYAFPHEAHELAAICRDGAGAKYRVGFLLQPTPLTAVRDLCNAQELMPQKSTFFYPKLATGMVVNPLG